MYKVEFCLLLWPLDLLSFDALLYFYDNKYVVILIVIVVVGFCNSKRIPHYVLLLIITDFAPLITFLRYTR